MTAGSIRRLSTYDEVPSEFRGGVCAIGNFDGVHRGHQAVLERARAIAADRGVPALALTFEPHPRTFFRPAEPVFRITPAPMRARLIGALGFDAIVEQAFTAEFAALDAKRFVSDVLVRGVGVVHAVTGFDFHFGKGRQGGPAFLIEAGARSGFGVTLVDAFRDEAADVISSSRIRSLLASGDVAAAAGLLGYRFTVSGEVVRGRQLGRTLGYPTANIALPAETGDGLAHGIYAARFRDEGGRVHDGVASFGRRPTVEDDGAPLLETYLFDFAGDLYGQTATVSLFGFLRGEEKFASLDELVDQMRRDEQEARALLAGVVPLSVLDRDTCFAGRDN